ncbi:MAG: glycoside hydrolase family 28 protein [Rikenellaceae bacterium]|nr:glycoside hydrolase family 28 protein [Rikenellaceae bacterium]
MDRIINNITRPVFNEREFNITAYGAIGDGETNCSMFIKKAIEECSLAGGGRVIVPAGKYFTGPVYLKSNVNLHLEEGANLLFSTNPDDYLPMVPTRWESVELMNYSPLIYAYKEENIAVTGKGTMDGQGSRNNWWPWKGRKAYGWKEDTPNQTDSTNSPALFAMAEEDVPMEKRLFGDGHYLRPQFIQPYHCNNVLIEGVTIINSPMWVIHPVLCNNVSIIGVIVESDGPNTDGCDPESCKNVLIKDCIFNTGDDCIALKSGRDRDGRNIGVPCENVVIQNCTTRNGHAGIAVGSEISGGAKNIFVENCTIINPMWAIRVKTSSMRGGVIEDIYIRNVEVEKVRNEAIFLTMLYEDKGEYMPTIRNIYITGLTVRNGGKGGMVIEGYPESPIRPIYFKNVNIDKADKSINISNGENIKFIDTYINGQKIN